MWIFGIVAWSTIAGQTPPDVRVVEVPGEEWDTLQSFFPRLVPLSPKEYQKLIGTRKAEEEIEAPTPIEIRKSVV